MSTPCYVSIEGLTQGNITAGAFTAESVGDIYVEGHEDQMLVQEVKHVVTVPTDPQSGQPSGQRVHRPFIITVDLNKAVPLLYNALVSGEQLPKIEVKWYRTSSTGQQEHFFTTTLTDAIVTEIDQVLPNAINPENKPYRQLIDISFAYRKIEWDHESAGTKGYDDWRNPRQA